MPHRSSGEYIPPHLEDGMRVCRLANAAYAAQTGHGMRYIVVCNVHEGIDPEQPLVILDAVDETYHFVADIVERLSSDLQRRYFGRI